MDHFNEVAGPVRPTVQIAKLRGAIEFFPARRSIDLALSRRERGKNRIQMFHHGVFAANHHAVTTFQTPNPTAGTNINVMDLATGELLGSPDVFEADRFAPAETDATCPHHG